MIAAALVAAVLPFVPAINAVRTPDVQVSPCATRYAQGWADRLYRERRFYHRDMGQLLRGCHARRAGEIMAMHVRSPRQAVRLWLHSAPHRRVMLNRAYTHLGVGLRRFRDGTYLVVVDFIER